MKIFLRQNVAKVGMAGEIVKVGDGYGRNFLIPKGLGVEITAENEQFYAQQKITLENRAKVIATETSMLAERLNQVTVTIKAKMHDDGKLYGAVTQSDITDLLSQQGFAVTKNQVNLSKPIKTKGTYKVVINLTSRLQSTITVIVAAE